MVLLLLIFLWISPRYYLERGVCTALPRLHDLDPATIAKQQFFVDPMRRTWKLLNRLYGLIKDADIRASYQYLLTDPRIPVYLNCKGRICPPRPVWLWQALAWTALKPLYAAALEWKHLARRAIWSTPYLPVSARLPHSPHELVLKRRYL
jgi:hypothetical protein